MPDAIHQAGKRDKLLRLPIGELVSCQLVVSCAACRADRIVFVRELVERCEEAATLLMLMPRLTCHVASCRRPPAAFGVGATEQVSGRDGWPGLRGGGVEGLNYVSLFTRA